MWGDSGMTDALVTIVRTEGGSALYKGLAPALIGTAPFAALNFASYDLLKKSFVDADVRYVSRPDSIQKYPALVLHGAKAEGTYFQVLPLIRSCLANGYLLEAQRHCSGFPTAHGDRCRR